MNLPIPRLPTGLLLAAALLPLMAVRAQSPLPQAPKPPSGEKKPPGPMDSGLATLEQWYAAQRSADLRSALARYADELTALQKSLIAAGDNSGAAKVQLELEKVLPVLGTAPKPAAGEGGADDFSMFEEAPPQATLPATEVTPADLDAILRAFQSVKDPGITAPEIPGTAAKPAGKSGRRILKMSAAQLTGSYVPDSGQYYWNRKGVTASWTLSDMPATSCRLVLHYACDDKTGGGHVTVRMGTAKLEAEVPVTGSWSRFRDLSIGPFPVTDSRVDLVVEAATLREGASYLFDLKAVMVIPGE